MSILERRKAKAAGLVITAPIAALAVTASSQTQVRASAIAPGDLLVFQSGTAASPDGLGGSPLLIDEINPSLTGQTSPVQAFNISSTSTVSTALFSNNNGSNGQMDLSDNGAIVTFGGYVGSSANEINQVTRDAVAVSATGTFIEPASYNSTANGQIRSAFTSDGSHYIFADKNGVFLGGSNNSPANNSNVRSIAGFGGTTFALEQNGSSADLFTVNSTGTTLTAVNGVSNLSNATDFFMLRSGTNGLTYDTLYIANGNQIAKFALNTTSGAFVAEGTDTLATKIDAITGIAIGGDTGVHLFVTVNANSTVQGAVQEITDSHAHNATIAGSAASTLFTAATGIDLYGVQLAPTPLIRFGSSGVGTELNGVKVPGGPNDINPTGSSPNVTPGFLNDISNATGTTANPAGAAGFVSITSIGGPSALELLGISITVKDTANGTSHVLTSTNDLATLQDFVNILNEFGSITNTDGGTSTAYVFGSAAAAAAGYTRTENALASGESLDDGNPFSILIATADPQDMSLNFSAEIGLDGISSLSITDIGVVPEPASALGLLAVGGAALMTRRRRKVH